MKFQKGQSGNLAGRPRGSQNKSTVQIRAFFQRLLEDNQQQIIEDLASVEPRDRLKFLVELTSFVIPRQTAASIQADVQTDTRISLYQQLDKWCEPQQIESSESPLIDTADATVGQDDPAFDVD